MRPVTIITDSTADLSMAIRQKHGIEMIPLYVRFNDQIYRDGIDLTTDELYEKVTLTNQIPTTSAVSPGDFIDFFRPFIESGHDILYTGIGSRLSATFQSALIAQQEFPEGRIHLVDSRNLSSGIALLVLKAAELRDMGQDGLTIRMALERLVPCVRSQFAIKTLDYLHKGGRASQTAKLIGTVLGIKPIIKVNDGILEVYKKPAGKMSRALDLMIDDFLNENENLDLERVMITHSQAQKSVDYILTEIKKHSNPQETLISDAGCVISSHCGPGTIGILYLVKS